MTTTAKKRLAFIDLGFHRKTRSTDFFQEILCREYEVTVFFDEGWPAGRKVDPHLVNKGNFDVVIFWQVVPNASNTLTLTCKNVLWVPMYDSVFQRSSLAWLATRGLNLKVICFSKYLYKITQRVGIHSCYVQYFPEPHEHAVSYGKPRVFLWQRINEISWPLVKRLLAGSEVEKSY